MYKKNVNLGFEYFKNYYYFEDLKDLKDKNSIYSIIKLNNELEKINLEESINENNRNLEESINENKRNFGNNGDKTLKLFGFKLKTTYPGLLIGSGYNHEIGKKPNNNEKPEYKLGFEFDYTSGLPVIPGSSIKGVLRSVFRKYFTVSKSESESEVKKFIEEYFKESIKKNFSSKIEDFLKHFENNIFEGIDLNGNQIASSNRDVFFDAYIVGKDSIDNKKESNYIGEDYIAPHNSDCFKNPIPIRFLKVLPNVFFKFDFILNDFKYNEEIIITAKEKEEFFQKIILDLGLGAKTNVGYGFFKK